jgi:pyruvate dehydrogenase E2 component (dihydrolipoamide acetyltransferase)
MATINMPRLSDTMQEGTIARWVKKQGDQVKKGDVLAEIETDKATMDLESYDEGVLEQILVNEGETAPIGQPVAVVGSGAGAEQMAQAGARPAQPAEAQAGPEPRTAAAGRAPGGQAESNGARGGAPAAPAPSREAPTGERGAPDFIKASPLAKHMAAEHDIDLSQIKGTGPGGRIVRDDIEDYLEQRGGAPAAAVALPQPTAPAQPVRREEALAQAQAVTPAGAEEVKLSRMQAAIARRLLEAKQTIPHFYVSTEVDMTETLKLRQTFNAAAGEDGVKVSVNDLIMKACALALEKFPEINSSIKDGSFLRHTQVNVGFAVDVPNGLVVPVVRDTNVKGVRAIARETKVLAEKARAGKLNQRDLEGGTFSVSNLGMMDVVEFIPIINPPEAAILGVGSARKRFVPDDAGQPVARDLMLLTLSADHRIAYGAGVARFLQEVKRLLQDPMSLLG